jgi:transposase
MAKSYTVLKRARISTKKFWKILKYFSLDIEATNFTQLSGLNRNTVNKYLLLVRKRIAEECEMEFPISGDIEVDESLFEARRVKGKRGRGASCKTIVFV